MRLHHVLLLFLVASPPSFQLGTREDTPEDVGVDVPARDWSVDFGLAVTEDPPSVCYVCGASNVDQCQDDCAGCIHNISHVASDPNRSALIEVRNTLHCPASDLHLPGRCVSSCADECGTHPQACGNICTKECIYCPNRTWSCRGK